MIGWGGEEEVVPRIQFFPAALAPIQPSQDCSEHLSGLRSIHAVPGSLGLCTSLTAVLHGVQTLVHMPRAKG